MRSLTKERKMSGRGFKKTTSERRGRRGTLRIHKELLKGQMKLDIVFNVALKYCRDLK